MRKNLDHAPGTDVVVEAPSATFNRRRFLALGGSVAVAASLGAVIGASEWDRLFGGGAAEGAASKVLPHTIGDRKLVLVTLYGGNDGLNTVVPYQDSVYLSARGPLAIEPSSVLPLSNGFGLHPGMPGFKKLWDDNHLAIVQGVGFAQPNFSHFESMDIWQTGTPTTPDASGWLGRWLDATGSDPLRAIGIGPTLPVALMGNNVQGAAIPAGQLILPGTRSDQALYSLVAHASASAPTLDRESGAANANLLEVQRILGPILNRTAVSVPLHLSDSDSDALSGTNAGALAIANGGGGLSSSNVLSTQLSIVANLILAGASTSVYSVELGGFDTHSAQADTQSTLLNELDTAVSAFVDAVGSSEHGRQTTVLVYTEFGRRVASNASAGTDHGWANVAFAAGPSVKGGFYGEAPDLSKLSEGNLVYTTDFRSLYATVFAEILGVDPKSFLGGTFPTLSFV
jgi:uncharacterized protein (DUF1501 family)